MDYTTQLQQIVSNQNDIIECFKVLVWIFGAISGNLITYLFAKVFLRNGA